MQSIRIVIRDIEEKEEDKSASETLRRKAEYIVFSCVSRMTRRRVIQVHSSLRCNHHSIRALFT